MLAFILFCTLVDKDCLFVQEMILIHHRKKNNNTNTHPINQNIFMSWTHLWWNRFCFDPVYIYIYALYIYLIYILYTWSYDNILNKYSDSFLDILKLKNLNNTFIFWLVLRKLYIIAQNSQVHLYLKNRTSSWIYIDLGKQNIHNI